MELEIASVSDLQENSGELSVIVVYAARVPLSDVSTLPRTVKA